MAHSSPHEDRRARISISGGTYALVGIGVGVAIGASQSLLAAIVQGLFWPATVGYWVIRALQHGAEATQVV